MAVKQVLVVFAIVGLIPASLAQNLSDQDFVIEDAVGDEQARTMTGDQSVAGFFPHDDILRAWIADETAESFDVGVELQEWEPTDGTTRTAEDRFITIHLQVKGAWFQARHTEICDDKVMALYTSHGANAALNEAEFMTCIPSAVNVDTATLQGTIFKETLLKEIGDAFVPGDGVDAFYVTVEDRRSLDVASSALNTPIVHDRLPDHDSAGPVPFEHGVTASSVVSIFSRQPLRPTNGEAGSFVFPARITNLGEEAQTFALESSGVPTGWSVAHASAIHLESGANRTIPLVLTVANNHQHGTTSTWTFSAIPESGSEDAASITVGLEYSTIPQPAGHHPTLYFHGFEAPATSLSRNLPWMNAAPEDPTPGATRGIYPGSGYDINDPGVSWMFLLSPALGVGLDFLTDREAIFETVIEVPGFYAGGEVTAQLFYCPAAVSLVDCPINGIPLADGQTDAPALQAGQQQGVNVPLGIAAEADFIEYAPGSNLAFTVRLSGQMTPEPQPNIDLASSTLTLPLRDYHDPLEAIFATNQDLSLDVLNEETLAGNPGDVVIVETQVTNVGEVDLSVTLADTGRDAEWGEWNAAKPLTVTAGQTLNVQYVVTIPDNALVGSEGEMLLLVTPTNGAGADLVKRVTIPITSEPVDDARDDIRDLSEKESPTAPIVLVVAGLLLLAARKKLG